MATDNFGFKRAAIEDNENFPKASSANYNANWNKVEEVLCDDFSTGTIETSTTEIVDLVPDSNVTMTWLVELKNLSSGRFDFFQIMIIYDGSEVTYNSFGLEYDNPIPRTISFDINSNNIRFSLTNDDDGQISYSVRRLSTTLKSFI